MAAVKGSHGALAICAWTIERSAALSAGIVVACVLQQLAVAMWTSVRRYIHSSHADFCTLVESHDDQTLALGLEIMYMSRSNR